MNQKNQLLLIEDDADDQLFFNLALSMIKPELNCVIATNGYKGLEVLEKMPELPVIIFLDLNMPIMNGFDCLIKLKDNPVLAPIPVIIFSTSSHEKDINKAKKLGAAAYLHKPNDIEKLSEKLRAAFSVDFQTSSNEFVLL